jgi:2-oxoglutarate dehydrogenase E1 component
MFAPGATESMSTEEVRLSYSVMLMVRAFQQHGHLQADLDPLEIAKAYPGDTELHEMYKLNTAGNMGANKLNYNRWFKESDLDKTVTLHASELEGILMKKKEWKIRDLIAEYEQAYCGKIGVEYMHISDRNECNWIRNRVEGLPYK